MSKVIDVFSVERGKIKDCRCDVSVFTAELGGMLREDTCLLNSRWRGAGRRPPEHSRFILTKQIVLGIAESTDVNYFCFLW